jgi:hypothetical protein
MSGAARRAATLRLRERLTLDETAYLVQDKIGGYYEDARSLLVEAVSTGKLPAERQAEVNHWDGSFIASVDPSTSTVATADLVEWMSRLEAKDRPSARNASSARDATWKSRVRDLGMSILKAHPKLSVDQIAAKVHEKMVDAKKAGESNVTGRGGKVPSAGTVKRHALKGIKS